MSADLQQRFEVALRAALDGAQKGAPVVHVSAAAPVISVAPVVKATLPELPQPLEVLDVRRHAAAWEYQVVPVRDSNGLLVSAKLTPISLVHFGELP